MKNKKAFTLIELLVVMGVIAVLIAMSVFGISSLLRSQRDTERRNTGRNLQVAVESFKTKSDEFYPSTLQKASNNESINLLDSSGTVIETVGLKGTARTTTYCYTLDNSEATYSLAVLLDDGNTWEQFGTTVNASGAQIPCTTDNV